MKDIIEVSKIVLGAILYIVAIYALAYWMW